MDLQGQELEQSLSKIAKWGKVVGYLFIILGGLAAVIGLFSPLRGYWVLLLYL